MSEPVYIRSGDKLLRCGFTTGTCAALAAAGAAVLLLTGEAPERVKLTTPKGVEVEVPLASAEREEDWADASVVKDAGDDPDVTDGIAVHARVSCQAQGITVDGGPGVGRVTRPGLDQPVGAAAINTVPRQMIRRALEEVCAACGYAGGLRAEIWVPEGARVAQKTFNPRLGIEGGVSILGTSGIVEPMSEQALVDTVALETRQAAAAGHRRLILTPGEYGLRFLQDMTPGLPEIPCVKCSNFIGDALDIAAVEGFEEVLLVGHIGKLVKLAGGVMNTHSRMADCRCELFCAHAALQGADAALCRRLMDEVTTDGCLQVLEQAGLRRAVTDSLLAAVQSHLDRRTAGRFAVGAVLFSNVWGALGQTSGADRLLAVWKGERRD